MPAFPAVSVQGAPTRLDVTLLAGGFTPVAFSSLGDLTGTAVSVVVGSDPAVTYAEGSGVTVPDPRTAGTATVRFDSDDFALGAFPFELRVLADGADDHETPFYGDLTVVDVLDVDLAAIRLLIGPAVPPTDADLLAAYGRLGSHKAVVLEYLERLLVELARQPTSWAVQGYSENWGGSISALRDLTASLRADVEVERGSGSAVLAVAHLVRDTPRR